METATPSMSASELDERIVDAERHAAAHAYEDGYAEIVLGALFLAIAALFLVESRASPGTPLAGISAIGLPVVVLVGLLAARALLPLWRERVTYPREGHAVPRRKSSRAGKAVAGLAAAIVAVGAVVALLLRPGAMAWLPALQGIFVGGLLAMLGARAGSRRLVVLAAWSAAVGLVVAAVGLEDAAAAMWLYAALGAGALVSGVAAWARFSARPGMAA